MTPDEIRLVETSFRTVMTMRDAAAAAFYDNLFRRDPSLRPMFARTDMAAQGVKLIASLGFVVQNLKHPAVIGHAARGLAQKHRGYGVVRQHYDTVGAALLDTLGAAFGDAFTPELRAAWATAYAALAGAMIEAAEADAA